MSPLVQLLERLDNEWFSKDNARHVVRESLHLLRNASVQISHLWRKPVVKGINPEIQDLANDDSLFKEAAPNLFSSGFESKIKLRTEAVSLLKSSRPPPPKKFFEGTAPLTPREAAVFKAKGQREFPTGSLA